MEPPTLSVVAPVYNEAAILPELIARCTGAAERCGQPFEVVLVDDASTDDTLEILRRHNAEGKVRIVEKDLNEGKAMALNDGLRCARGDIILIVDADARTDSRILRYIVPHFDDPRVAAVTGNPRVLNRANLATQLQAIEFTSIISLQKRAQRIWGRMLTVSGVVAAFHRRALEELPARHRQINAGEAAWTVHHTPTPTPSPT